MHDFVAAWDKVMNLDRYDLPVIAGLSAGIVQEQDHSTTVTSCRGGTS